MKQVLLPLILLSALACELSAQVPNPTQSLDRGTQGDAPIFRATVTARSTQAVNYRHRSGATKIDFTGTALMAQARGEAEVNSKQGALEIKAKFRKLDQPTKFGPEYLTYVLWAISPEGRPERLGEVVLNGGNDDDSKILATSSLQAFALIVTAEPYFAVTQPSDVVVLENQIRSDTTGKWETVDAKYELLQRGTYTYNPSRVAARPVAYDKRNPLELSEARNAVQIAQLAGADKYAGPEYQKAVGLLRQADDYSARKAGVKPIITVAREAVQTAEDARVIAIKRQQDEALALQRQDAADREAAARAQAEQATRQQAVAEQQARSAEQQAKLDEQRRQQAEAERQAAERAKQEADTARAAAQVQQQAAQAETARAQQATAEAERLRAQAEADRAGLRKQLLDQFNAVLETRDTTRGLIVNMTDVLFDSGRHTLRPAAREKLARISGIVASHPGLNMEVEGHTDSVGGDAYNQRLSEQRADEVRAYLVGQSVQSDKIVARGLGKGQPVASNDTAQGRQQNRRVEMVISGEIIGTRLGQPATTAVVQ